MSSAQRFHDRREAGQLLARRLADHKDRDNVVVLGLPRGGVPVGYEIARQLQAPIDVYVVRKLGVPWQPELAMGAIASHGTEVLNGDVVAAYNIPPHVIGAVAERERRELDRRLQEYRGPRPPLDLRDRTVILVDDGLATGSTMRAAVKAIRHEQPRAVIIAVPVAAIQTCREFREEVDEIICLRTPPDLTAVGYWYEDFSQTTDAEVRDLLSHDTTRSHSVEAHTTGETFPTGV